uniref:Uncharacterized protein n=1 Tax=Pavo cristatus TaxID=9049 RepID=A0A8C9FVH5_PAVCR
MKTIFSCCLLNFEGIPQEHLKPIMDDYDIRSAASILASVKEQEARFERLTRALEEERRNVSLQLERANQPADRMSISLHNLFCVYWHGGHFLMMQT